MKVSELLETLRARSMGDEVVVFTDEGETGSIDRVELRDGKIALRCTLPRAAQPDKCADDAAVRRKAGRPRKQ